METANMSSKDIMSKISKEAEAFNGVTRKKVEVPREVAEALLTYFKKEGKFSLPTGTLNRMIGYDSDNNRRPKILKSLQEKHSDLLPDGKQWYIATTENDTKYVIFVRDIPEPKEETTEKEE